MPEAHSAARVLGGQSGHAAASAAAPLFATPDSVSEYEVDDLADRVTASSLDTQESTSHFHQDLYRNFRHSGWHRQRLAVLKQIDRFCGGFDQPPSRTAYTYVSRDRFCRCGSYAWVQRTVDDPPSYRVVSQHCRHRFCLPCQQDRGRLIAANLREKLPQAQLRFVTLTVRALDMSLAEALDHLYDSFSRLRRTISGATTSAAVLRSSRSLGVRSMVAGTPTSTSFARATTCRTRRSAWLGTRLRLIATSSTSVL